MAGQGLGELLAALDVGLEGDDDLLEVGVLGLIGDAVERGPEIDAGADHDRQLGGEVQDVALLGLAGVDLGKPGGKAGGDGRVGDRRHAQNAVALVTRTLAAVEMLSAARTPTCTSPEDVLAW